MKCCPVFNKNANQSILRVNYYNIFRFFRIYCKCKSPTYNMSVDLHVNILYVQWKACLLYQFKK